MDPQAVVASFDSASVMHAGLAAALRGQRFAHLGNPAPMGAATRILGRLPWAVVRPAYTRIGASEGIAPERLGEVDLDAAANWLADGYPERTYPAAFIGSSNGALTHLAAAMQAPWLPGTVLVPVARSGRPDRPDEALEFGRRHGPALLERNPGITLHHMHDQVQDELMVAKMTYFRTKWSRLPQGYARFLARLAPGAPVFLAEDTSTWPVVRVGPRHVFQTGAQGGLAPHGYLERPHTPEPDGESPEAEWGADPGLGSQVRAWCAAHDHPVVEVRYHGPQSITGTVSDILRAWYRRRGEPADRLLVPSFILADPWQTVATATVPYWTFFPVRPALRALEHHLEQADPYESVGIMAFQHGANSAGAAAPHEWLEVARRHARDAHLVAFDPRRFPHDISTIGRYGGALAGLPDSRHPWSPLDVASVVAALGGASAAGGEVRRG